MKKTAISLALSLLLVLALSPAAGATGLAPLPDENYGAEAPVVYSCANITCNVGDTAIISVIAVSHYLINKSSRISTCVYQTQFADNAVNNVITNLFEIVGID